MTNKKRSRAASRAKPVLRKITVAEQEEQKRKELLIEDFRKNVAIKVEQLRAEQQQMEKGIMQAYTMFRRELKPYEHISMEQIYQSMQGKRHDFTKQTCTANAVVTSNSGNSETTSGVAKSQSVIVKGCTAEKDQIEESVSADAADFKAPMKFSRESGVTSLLEATANLSKMRKRRAAKATPASAKRSSNRTRKAIAGVLPPPSSTLPLRNRRALVTPAGRGIMPGAGLLVTPKFDPRLPLPPGTVRRRPLPNEVLISLTGSPMKVSPDKPVLKDIFSQFLNSVEEQMPPSFTAELKKLHSVFEHFIDSRESDN